MGQAIIVAIIAIIIVAMLVYNYESKIRDLKEGFAKQLSLVKEAHASQLAALKEMNKECADRGIVFQVISWSNADKLETYNRLLDLGITSFATDYPEVLIEAVYGGEAPLPIRAAARNVL